MEFTNLDFSQIMYFSRVVTETVGEKWVLRKIKEDKKRRKQTDQLLKKNKAHFHLYQLDKIKVHPLIKWAIEFDKWKYDCIKTKKIVLNESVIKYSTLGMSLEKVRKQTGFNKILSRLKLEKEFFSSSFEVEVAASYISKGYTVNFIKERGEEKTPDLKVVRNNGDAFWVECKCKQLLTKRDKEIEGVWTDLESSLIRELCPKKINVSIMVNSLRDPVRNEINNLVSNLQKNWIL